MIESKQTANENTATTKQILALVGASLLFVGVFLPIVSVPIMGSQNYFQNGKGDGAIVLVLAVVSIMLAITRVFRYLWITGVCSVSLLLFTLMRFVNATAQLREQVKTEVSDDNPFSKALSGLADAAVNSVQLQWGWGVLMLGAILILAAAAIRGPARTEYTSPGPKRSDLRWITLGSVGLVTVGAVLIAKLPHAAPSVDYHLFRQPFKDFMGHSRMTIVLDADVNDAELLSVARQIHARFPNCSFELARPGTPESLLINEQKLAVQPMGNHPDPEDKEASVEGTTEAAYEAKYSLGYGY